MRKINATVRLSRKCLRAVLAILFLALLHFTVRAQATTATITHSGWYRIAQNGTTLGGTNGSRAAAHFIVMDKTSSLHQTVEFLAYINYSKMPSITVLNNSYYAPTVVPIAKVRILSPTAVYGGSAVEVYINVIAATNSDSYYIEDNDQAAGWTATSWQSVSTGSGDSDGVPTGFTACVLDLKNLVTGYVTSGGHQSSFTNGNFYTSGNILVGKTTQTNSSYKLDVAGKVRANEITVNSTGADYVFDAAYTLQPLATVKDYIEKHHHLPDIPSAAQMQQNGLRVGENQRKLLQKIEELTLYLLQQEKKIATQDQELKALKEQTAQMEDLQHRLQRLEALSGQKGEIHNPKDKNSDL